MTLFAPTVIVLAGGSGTRFRACGGASHKLDALLAGKPVLQHVLDTVTAAGLPCHLVRPPGGTAGMGDSIALGVNATPSAQGWLILPGDLPLVSSGTLRAVAQALQEAPIVVPYYADRRGHPVGFCRDYFAALAALKGDSGAARLVQAARDQGRVRDLTLEDAGITCDVDTPADLRRAATLLKANPPSQA